jgi:hypothetical protein
MDCSVDIGIFFLKFELKPECLFKYQKYRDADK